MRSIRVLVYASEKLGGHLISIMLRRLGYHACLVPDIDALAHVEEIYQPDIVIIRNIYPRELAPILSYFSGKYPIILLGNQYAIPAMPQIDLTGVDIVASPILMHNIKLALDRASKSLRHDLRWLNGE